MANKKKLCSFGIPNSNKALEQEAVAIMLRKFGQMCAIWATSFLLRKFSALV